MQGLNYTFIAVATAILIATHWVMFMVGREVERRGCDQCAENDELIAELKADCASWKKMAKDDEFWAVRSEALKQIGIHHGSKNLEFLKECATDKSSKVRTAAVKALGELKDQSLKKYYKNIFNTENSYAVKSEVLIAIGKCGKKSDISFLSNAGKQNSYRDVVYNASVKAIESINEKK